MGKFFIHQLEVLIELIDQDILNYKSVLERTGKKNWQDIIDDRLEIRKELYNQLILRWYMRGFNDELKGTSTIVSDDKILNKAYSIGAEDAIIGDDIPSRDYRSDDEIIRQIIGG